MSMKALAWDGIDGPGAWSGRTTTIGCYHVSVCHDDEGPMQPAYYWWIVLGDPVTDRPMIADGWGNSIPNARKQAVAEGRRLAREERRDARKPDR